MTPTKSDLPQGTLDLLIMKVVALGPVHGYAIAQRLDQASRGVVQVPQGSLYPALHRLKEKPPMTWWQRLFRRRKLDEELEKELSFHLEEHTSDLIAQGLSPREARRRARLALGGPEQVKEACRDARGTRWLNDLVRDLRYAVRILAKQPGFTLVAVLTLGLGIGVNTAILSAVNGFILRPLSADRPEELLAPYWGRKSDAQVWDRFSYANYLDLREQNKSFTDLCAFTWATAGMSAGESHNAVGGER